MFAGICDALLSCIYCQAEAVASVLTKWPGAFFFGHTHHSLLAFILVLLVMWVSERNYTWTVCFLTASSSQDFHTLGNTLLVAIWKKLACSNTSQAVLTYL